MKDIHKLIMLGVAGYLISKIAEKNVGVMMASQQDKTGVAGLGQEFPSQVLPNMVIGMGPQVVPSGTFDIGAQFPLTGEAVMGINPETGAPQWNRTIPVAQMMEQDQYWTDVRSELFPQFPEWVVRRERERREQLLRDTNASGAMRTALDFTPEQGVALEDGWKVTNMFGLSGIRQRRRDVSCVNRSVGNIDAHLSMMMGLGENDGETWITQGSGGGTVSMPKSDWERISGGSPTPQYQEPSGKTPAQTSGSDLPIGYSQKLYPKTGGYAPWAQPGAGTPWEGPPSPERQQRPKVQRVVGGGGNAPAPVAGGEIASSAMQRMQKFSQPSASQGCGRCSPESVFNAFGCGSSCRNQGINTRYSNLSYRENVGKRTSMDIPVLFGNEMLPPLIERIYCFSDGYLLRGSGSSRFMLFSQICPSGGAGGAGAESGPDYWAMYDAWLKGQPYGAQTHLKAAQWQGEDPSAPMVGPDWGGGDDAKFSFNFTGGQATPALVSPSHYQNFATQRGKIFDVGQGPSVGKEGAFQELF